MDKCELFRRVASLALLTLIVAGVTACASYPTDPNSQIDYHLSRAQDQLSRSAAGSAVIELMSAAARPTPNAKERVQTFVSTQANATPLIRSWFDDAIKAASTPSAANTTYDEIVSVMPPSVAAPLIKQLNERVVRENVSGPLRFTFGDDRSRFPDLQTPKNERQVVDNTINRLQGKDREQRRESLMGLTEYVSRQGLQSAEGVRIRSLLPTMNITKNELELVRQTYSEFAAQREREVSLKVHFVFKGGDRLMRDDLERAMQSELKGLVFVASENDAQLILTIESSAP